MVVLLIGPLLDGFLDFSFWLASPKASSKATQCSLYWKKSNKPPGWWEWSGTTLGLKKKNVDFLSGLLVGLLNVAFFPNTWPLMQSTRRKSNQRP